MDVKRPINFFYNLLEIDLILIKILIEAILT